MKGGYGFSGLTPLSGRRRISGTVQSEKRRHRITWSRILTEGAVIVFSILLAFALQAWWEARQERSEEFAYLQSLQSDFRESREWGLDHLEKNRQIIANNRQLMDLLAAPDPAADSAGLPALVASVFWIYDFEPVLATYQDMVNSGDLRLLRSEALRLALSNFEQKVERVDRLDQAIWELWFRFDLPFLNASFNLSYIYNNYRGAADRLQLQVPALEFDNDGLEPDLDALRSREFHNILVARAVSHQDAIVHMQSTLRQIDAILELLDSELARLSD